MSGEEAFEKLLKEKEKERVRAEKRKRGRKVVLGASGVSLSDSSPEKEIKNKIIKKKRKKLKKERIV